MTYFRKLADTMRQYSDTLGDHHWQAGRAIDLLLENTEQHVYSARMMASAALMAAQRLGMVEPDVDGITGAQAVALIGRLATVAKPRQWQPIESAPKDNARPLLLARFNGDGVLAQLDFNGAWRSESESWEIPEVYYYWESENGIEDPTHWAYQDEPVPQSEQAKVYAFRRKGLADFVTCDYRRFVDLSLNPKFETTVFFAGPGK